MPQTTTSPTFVAALSNDPDVRGMVRTICDQVTEHLPDPVDLLVVFLTAEHIGSLAQIRGRLEDALGPGAFLGLTAQGVIGTGRELEKGPGMAVLAASLPGVEVQSFSYQNLDWASVLKEPQALTNQLNVPAQTTRAMVLLADPYSTPITGLLPALGTAWPGVPIIGGMASAGRKPGQNRLILDGQILNQGAVGVLLGGNVQVHCVVSQGCRPVGRPLVITGAKRNVVRELGGRKAMDAIQEMAGELEESDRELLRKTPLMVGRVINEYQDRFGRGDFLIRNVVGVDSEEGYIAIGDPLVRMGQTIQFHVRDQKTAREDFQLLLDGQKVHGPARGALLFTCNGRGTTLFDEPDADASMIGQALGPIPLAGFFAAGEIGPVGDQNFLHGQTASLAVFRPLP